MDRVASWSALAASQLRSVAGFNEDTRATIQLRAMLQEWAVGRASRKRCDAHAYGVPYWELYTAQQLGITVSEYRSLPHNERWAWKLYFELDQKTRDSLIKKSQEVEHEDLLKKIQEYKDRQTEVEESVAK